MFQNLTIIFTGRPNKNCYKTQKDEKLRCLCSCPQINIFSDPGFSDRFFTIIEWTASIYFQMKRLEIRLKCQMSAFLSFHHELITLVKTLNSVQKSRFLGAALLVRILSSITSQSYTCPRSHQECSDISLRQAARRRLR